MFKNPLVFIAVCVFLSGCSLPREINFDKKEFNKNYSKWKSLNIIDYKFTYSSFGFSSYWIKIKVENGEALGYESGRLSEESNSDYFTEEGIKRESKKIDDYFDEIINFYNKYNGKNYCDCEMYYTDIIVRYNQEYGYPESWYFKYHCPDNLEVDGNFQHKVLDFEKTE